MNSYYLAYLIHVRRQPAPLDTTAMSHDITFVHEGEFEYEIDGERFTVRTGEALYCPKGAKKIRLKSDSVYYTSRQACIWFLGRIIGLPHSLLWKLP